VYVLQLVHKFTKSQVINDSIKKMQQILQFPLMDDLVNSYITLERLHLRNCFIKAVTADNQNYVKAV